MRISKRICSVVLAGTLACGLGIGSLALADSATPEADATKAAAEQLNQIQSTQLSYTTLFGYGVQVQMPADLFASEDVYTEDGVITWEYEDETRGISVEIDGFGVDEETAQMVVEALTTSFTEEFEGAEAVTTTRIVDGYRIVDVFIVVAGEDQSEPGACIELTFLFTDDAVATVMSYYAVDDTENMLRFDQMHSSLAPSAYYAATADVPTTEPTEPTAPAEPTAKPAAPSTGVAADATVFELPGWNVAINVSTDAMFLDTIPEDFWDTDVAGKSVIGVPVTLTNTGTETSNAWWDLTFQFFGPKGVAQGNGFSWVFDDDYANLPDMRKGATADAYLYIEDEGDGVYAIEVSAYDENYNTVKYEVEFELTHDA